MKARKFKIRIQSLDRSLDEFKQDWKALEKGTDPRTASASPTLLFSDLSMVSRVLSTERLRLIQMIREKSPASVSELAKLLHRSQANVHRDVHYLAELGILELKKLKKDGMPEIVQPRFNWTGFDIDLAG